MAKVYSGTDYIDGVLSNSGRATTPVNSWSTETTVGSGVSLTYDWLTSAPPSPPAGGFDVFTASQHAGAIAAMDLFAEIADLSFTRQSTGTADLEFGTVDFGGTTQGGFTAGLASTAWTIIGNPATNTYFTHADVYLTNTFAFMTDQTPGEIGFGTMLHEIGHALGLAHTFDNLPVPAGTDSQQYSMMSYTDHPGMGSTEPFAPLLYDIAALQYLYGANTTTRTGADTYSWATNASAIEAIWDAGGTDLIDGSNQSKRVIIDLNEGAFSSIGATESGGDALNNIAIAYGVVIENANGGHGADMLTGNASDNVLQGNEGGDSLNGGEGIDTASYVMATGRVTLDLRTGGTFGDAAGDTFSLIENVIGTGFDDDIIGDDGDNVLDGGDGDDEVSGGIGDDTLRGNDGNDNLRAEAGADVLSGGAGNDIVNGGDGEDLLFGGLGKDLMFGGNGTDKMFGGAGSDKMFGGAQNDIVNGGADNDIINTGSGNDLIFAQNGNDLVFAQGGNDKVFGGAGNDKVFGGAGNDAINTGAGDDIIFGGAGIDTITSATGNDVISGGGSGDLFIFAANQGDDRITDFTGGDRLDISAFGVMDGGGSNQDWRSTTTSVITSDGGANVTIEWDGAGTLVLENTTIASLTDSDFVF